MHQLDSELENAKAINRRREAEIGLKPVEEEEEDEDDYEPIYSKDE